jgi:hypothetical protein
MTCQILLVLTLSSYNPPKSVAEVAIYFSCKKFTRPQREAQASHRRFYSGSVIDKDTLQDSTLSAVPKITGGFLRENKSSFENET